MASSDIFLTTALSVGIAGAIGYGIFRLVAPKGRAVTPAQVGRKWFAWLALIIAITLLPKFIRTFDINPLAIWALNFIVWGVIAFIGGWLYGRLTIDRTVVAATSRPATSVSAELAVSHGSKPTRLVLLGRGLYRCDQCHGQIDVSRPEWDAMQQTKQCPYCRAPVALPS